MRTRLIPRPHTVVAPVAGLALIMMQFADMPIATAEPWESSQADQSADVPTTSIDPFIAEASARFAMPERWIHAVMQAESAGDPRAVSRAGAMGLMQIMPATWAELRARHRLGNDVFDPRDNILAGTAYLREMYDRFGSPGFLAAYNGGPARYADHLATGRALPRETRAYMAALVPAIGASSAELLHSEAPILPDDWRAAPLFVARLELRSGGGAGGDIPAVERPSRRSVKADAPPSHRSPNSLFVRSGAEEAR